MFKRHGRIGSRTICLALVRWRISVSVVGAQTRRRLHGRACFRSTPGARPEECVPRAPPDPARAACDRTGRRPRSGSEPRHTSRLHQPVAVGLPAAPAVGVGQSGCVLGGGRTSGFGSSLPMVIAEPRACVRAVASRAVPCRRPRPSGNPARAERSPARTSASSPCSATNGQPRLRPRRRAHRGASSTRTGVTLELGRPSRMQGSACCRCAFWDSVRSLPPFCWRCLPLPLRLRCYPGRPRGGLDRRSRAAPLRRHANDSGRPRPGAPGPRRPAHAAGLASG